MKKIILLVFIIGGLLCSLNAQGIVIKKGTKEQKVKPLNEKKVNPVSTKKSVRVGWSVDDLNKNKKDRLNGIQESNPGLSCH